MPNLKDDLASLRIDQSARAGTSRRGLWITLAVILVAVATAGWMWSTRVDAITVRAMAVKAETGGGPAAGAVLNASGYVTARRRATVSSKVTGKVLEVFVEEGKPVHKGQVLARLDDSQMRAALAVAEAQLATARRGAAEDEARLNEAQLTLARRGAPGSPVMNTLPDSAWPMPSKPSLCASGPLRPNALVATRIARGLSADTLA